MSAAKITPMLQQYLSIKEAYPDVLLFYRMGDFYELFFEDAHTAARELEITLTSRNKKDKTPIPMCGVPVRAVQGYIARLIEKGYKVAICEQTEDPAVAKGLVRREVVRVITPGMILENEFLDASANNYILSLVRGNGSAGLAYLDISTGTFRLAESDDLAAVIEETFRIAPSEVLLPETAQSDDFYGPLLRRRDASAITFLKDSSFDFNRNRERLIQQFRTRSLEGYGCEQMRSGIRAAGALVFYIRETQKQDVGHLSGIESYSLDSYLLIDDFSCRNLELSTNLRIGGRRGTLLSILDRTVTPMGARLLRHWMRYPLLDAQLIRHRLDAVEAAKRAAGIRANLREILKSVYDLERLSSKISMGHGNARDLTALKRSIFALPDILTEVSQLDTFLFQWDIPEDRLLTIAHRIETAIREDAPPTLHDGGMIKSGYDAQLDELIQISRDGKGWLARLEVEEREKTGISSLKVRYNKVFGYYIEVPKSRSESVPSDYVRKQTLVNAERYITDELKDFEAKVLGAEERRAALEFQIFGDLRLEIAEEHMAMQAAARFVARLDTLLALAEVADQEDYTRPDINLDGRISVEDGRHPVVEKLLAGERFVPNSVEMDNDSNQVLIITGPNMAGKSTILRQVALTVIMAQMGSFVPARNASTCIVDRIFTRVGALDNLSQGQSTFMVEMEETANILNNATPHSLVIMDEIGRGTSTFDGLSIAWAVAEYLHGLKGQGVKTLFATHYHELTRLEDTRPRVRNFNIAVKEWNDEVIFLRKLVPGGTNRSYGIQVARLAGLPNRVIQRAKKILFDIENGEDNPTIASAPDPDTAAADPEQTQLTLFRTPDQLVVDQLSQMDISTMTPLDALNRLSELQQIVNRKTETEKDGS